MVSSRPQWGEGGVVVDLFKRWESTAPPMGDRLAVAVGLMGSEDPADSAF